MNTTSYTSIDAIAHKGSRRNLLSRGTRMQDKEPVCSAKKKQTGVMTKRFSSD